jgi:Ca-activated chloride channel family protein
MAFLDNIQFQFAVPWLLALLVIVPVFAVLAVRRRQSAETPRLRYANTNLILAPTRSSWRLFWRPALMGLRLFALVLIIVAAARPQTGEAREVITREVVDIALALDISGSMASLDFQPDNRLEAAKQVINDFIDERDNDRVGLVVFSRDAFVQSPPTVDHNVLRFLVDEVKLATDLGLEDGTAIGLGLVSAASMLKDSAANSRVIILLTDGVNTGGEIDPLTATAVVEALGIRVHTIGMGREGQVPVPRIGGPEGELILQESELDEETLRRISNSTGGQFFRATDTAGLQQVYDQINTLEKAEVQVSVFTRHQEAAGWLLAPALLILLLELILRNTFFREIP